MKEEILKLRAEGKSYREIQKILGCSRGTVSYHCGLGQKEKYKERKSKNRQMHIICSKLDCFSRKKVRDKCRDFQRERIGKYDLETRRYYSFGNGVEKNFGYRDFIEKFGDDPVCYLTGRKIDLLNPKTYALDHVVPARRGGTNEFDNLGLACRKANAAKSDMLVDEFIQLCKEVLEHNGYEVKKNGS